MSVYKSIVANAVMRKGVNDELLTWVMRRVWHNVMLVGRVFMCTTESASLTNSSRSSCIFVRVVGTDCVLLMPLHTSVPWMSRGRVNIFIQRFGSYSDRIDCGGRGLQRSNRRCVQFRDMYGLEVRGPPAVNWDHAAYTYWNSWFGVNQNFQNLDMLILDS